MGKKKNESSGPAHFILPFDIQIAESSPFFPTVTNFAVFINYKQLIIGLPAYKVQVMGLPKIQFLRFQPPIVDHVQYLKRWNTKIFGPFYRHLLHSSRSMNINIFIVTITEYLNRVTALQTMASKTIISPTTMTTMMTKKHASRPIPQTH